MHILAKLQENLIANSLEKSTTKKHSATEHYNQG